MSKARLLGQQNQKERFRTQRFRPGRCQKCGAKIATARQTYDGMVKCRSCGAQQKYYK